MYPHTPVPIERPRCRLQWWLREVCCTSVPAPQSCPHSHSCQPSWAPRHPTPQRCRTCHCTHKGTHCQWNSHTHTHTTGAQTAVTLCVHQYFTAGMFVSNLHTRTHTPFKPLSCSRPQLWNLLPQDTLLCNNTAFPPYCGKV